MMSWFVEVWQDYFTVSLSMANPLILINYVKVDTSSILGLNNTSQNKDVIFFVADYARFASISRWLG